MSITAQVNAGGINPTHIYSSGVQTGVLQPGQNAQITSPADVTVEPGGSVIITTSDGSTIGVGPNVAASLFQGGSEPSLNAWDMLVKDTASGWSVRFSDLSLPTNLEVDISAPNASDGLTLQAPDNSTQVITLAPEQFLDLEATWTNPTPGSDNTMQITQIVATIEENIQYTWNINVGWAQTR